MDPPRRDHNDRDGKDGRDRQDGHDNHKHDRDHHPNRQLFEPHLVPEGLTMQGQEVLMAKMSLLWPDTINDQRTIWTRSLGPCQCLATFDMATGDRSMIHLPAGTTTELLNDMIAGMAAGTVDIVIFIVNGDVGSQDHFENTEVPKFKKDIIDGLKRATRSTWFRG